jgi:hypothetical protein
MSQVQIYSDFIPRTEGMIAGLRTLEAELQASVARMSGKPIDIPVIIPMNQAMTLAQEVATSRPLEVPLIASDGLTTAIESIRAKAQAEPITVPVVEEGGGSAAAEPRDGRSSGNRPSRGQSWGEGDISAIALTMAAIKGVNVAIDAGRLLTAEWTRDFDAQVKAAGDLEEAVKHIPFGIGQAALTAGEQINNLLTQFKSVEWKDGSFQLETGLGNRDYEEQLKKESAELDKHSKYLGDQAKQLEKINTEAERYADTMSKIANAPRGDADERQEQKMQALRDEFNRRMADPKMHEGGDVNKPLTATGEDVKKAGAAAIKRADEDYRDKQIEETADEEERMRDRISAYHAAARKADLAGTKNDFEAELQEFDRMWEHKLSKMDEGEEKTAAVDERDALRHRLKAQNQMELDDLAAKTRDLTLQSQDKPLEAKLDDLEDRISKARRSAGDDPTRRSAETAYGISELEKMKHDLVESVPQAKITSLEAYVRDVQIGGTSKDKSTEDISALIKKIDAAEQALRDGGPLAPNGPFSQTVDKWTPAVDKFAPAVDALAAMTTNAIQLFAAA